MNEGMKDLFLLLFNDNKPVFRDEIVITTVIIMDISKCKAQCAVENDVG